MVKEMCAAADISGHKTNHSLRATGAYICFKQEYLRSWSSKGLDTSHWQVYANMNIPPLNSKKQFVRSSQLTMEIPARIPALTLRSPVLLAVCPTLGRSLPCNQMSKLNRWILMGAALSFIKGVVLIQLHLLLLSPCLLLLLTSLRTIPVISTGRLSSATSKHCWLPLHCVALCHCLAYSCFALLLCFGFLYFILWF